MTTRLRPSVCTLSCLVISTALSATSAAAQDAPAAGEVYVEGVTYAGNGCPAGSVADDLSPDAKAITFLFDQFAVDTTANGGHEVKKSCALNLQLHVPAGWTYTLFSVDYRGYADLDQNSNSQLHSYYAVDGQSVKISNMQMHGAETRDYEQTAWVPLDALPWLSCTTASSTVTITTDVQVNGPHGIMTVDSVDGQISQNYGIAWKPCSPSTTWVGTCEVDEKFQWGNTLNRSTAAGTGATFQEAKDRATATATAQCEAVRAQIQRPLLRALTVCKVNTDVCGARPD